MMEDGLAKGAARHHLVRGRRPVPVAEAGQSEQPSQSIIVRGASTVARIGVKALLKLHVRACPVP